MEGTEETEPVSLADLCPPTPLLPLHPETESTSLHSHAAVREKEREREREREKERGVRN